MSDKFARDAVIVPQARTAARQLRSARKFAEQGFRWQAISQSAAAAWTAASVGAAGILKEALDLHRMELIGVSDNQGDLLARQRIQRRVLRNRRRAP